MSDTNLDAQYEILAKGIYLYNNPNAQIQAQVIENFAAQGYAIDRVFDDPNTSLQALGLRSIDGSRPPVLVYQGTAGAEDLPTNRDPRGVGFSQFFANKQDIQDWIEGITNNQQLNPQGFKPDVTGQSLGGALTQWTVSELPTLIGSAVTFEATGIASSALDRFSENGGDPSQVTQYMVDGDYRALVGEAFIPGKIIVSDFNVSEFDQVNDYADRKHFSGILSDIRSLLPADLSPEIEAQIAIYDVPKDRTLSEISVDDLNKSDFTWQGKDWQILTETLKVINPNLAALGNRQNFQEQAIANTDLLSQSNRRLAPEEVNQPTAESDILFGSDCDDTISGLVGSDYIRAGAGDDMLFGDEGDDGLLGNKGDDVLVGGEGDDVLTGSAGSDLFLFDANTPFNALGIDRITDFNQDEDSIGLSRAVFTALGEDLVDSFETVTDDDAAATNSALIVYNTTNGKLFYNSDGAIDGFGEGGQFADLVNSPALSAENFVLT
jgi:serralysin